MKDNAAMALLAESLIDEWLNRKGYFTMRGVKHSGVDEIDLLGIKREDGGLLACHVEAQISFRPVGYITKLTKKYCDENRKARTSALHRDPALLKECVRDWVDHKYNSNKKLLLREHVWPGLHWHRIFVHGKAQDATEIDEIAKLDIEVVSFSKVLSDLAQKSKTTGAAGTDISEIIGYFAEQEKAAAAFLLPQLPRA